MATEPMSPLPACSDVAQVQVNVIKFHGPEFQAQHGQLQFSVAVQLQTGKAGPQKKTGLVPAQRVESWLEASWGQQLAFDGVSWLAEEKTLPLLRFKVYGHRRAGSSGGGSGGGGKKSVALWSAAVSCASFFRFPNQAATLMLDKQVSSATVDSSSSAGAADEAAASLFDSSSLQVEIRVVPAAAADAPPAAAMLRPGTAVSSTIPINFNRDSLFVAVKGVKKLQHDVSADQSLQAQAELRVGSDGPFEVSRIVALKRGSRSAAVQGTFLLPYHQSARVFTPVLTVNVNIFVGSAQNNVTMGSFCVDVPVFAFLLNGRHAVADWFPLHRHNSITGNVKGYVFLELQHCFHSSLLRAAGTGGQPGAVRGEGIYFKVLEATQLNMGPDLGQSSLHVEVRAQGRASVRVCLCRRGPRRVWEYRHRARLTLPESACALPPPPNHRRRFFTHTHARTHARTHTHIQTHTNTHMDARRHSGPAQAQGRPRTTWCWRAQSRGASAGAGPSRGTRCCSCPCRTSRSAARCW